MGNKVKKGKQGIFHRKRGGFRWVLLMLLGISVPLETGWILNGAKAAKVQALSAESEEFRCFDIKAEELAERAPFRETYFRELAYRSMYGETERVPFFFRWQAEDEIVDSYLDAYGSVLRDISCFPVALDGSGEAGFSYENSWGNARSYGGRRRHEGVDIMTSNNVPGYYPAVSVCDGVVEKIGWLELGGYRIGIRSEHGLYAYYAHLDSYRQGLASGDTVKAGETLGYVGNSGYGKEGTKGKFDVHLHFGMYIDIQGQEVSINPYEILRYLEA